jgi:hypothetical protein
MRTRQTLLISVAILIFAEIGMAFASTQTSQRNSPTMPAALVNTLHTLRLRVVDNYGNPVADAKVVLDEIRKPGTHLTRSAVTNKGGVVSFSNLKLGNRYFAIVSDNRYAVSPGFPVILKPQSTTDLKINAEIPGMVLGTVVTASGEPLTGQRVFADKNGSFLYGAATTDSEGKFRIGRLPAGKIHLKAETTTLVGNVFITRIGETDTTVVPLMNVAVDPKKTKTLMLNKDDRGIVITITKETKTPTRKPQNR